MAYIWYNIGEVRNGLVKAQKGKKIKKQIYIIPQRRDWS